MNARLTALDTLSGVLKHKAYLNLELKQVLHSGMSVEDRRFITALVSTTLENLYRIDYVLTQFVTAKRVHKVIQNILRLGVCQLLYFESVPESAAVNESVKLVQAKGKQQLKGFVNATLRNIAQNLGKIEYPKASEDFIEYLHVMYSYPKWLCEKYVAEYGKEQAEMMLSYRGNSSLTCVRQNRQRQIEPLTQFEPGYYCEDAYYIKHAADIENMPLFKKGYITVQGEASMVCVRAAGIERNHRVLDVCAAPGGKSLYAAQLAADGKVVALDLHEHRVKLIEANVERLGITNIQMAVADATQYCVDYEEQFDVVLVDAPCSALGLLYRKPDIKLFKVAEDIAALVPMQQAILENCSRYVKAGGTLLYSTCTIDRCENEEVVESFLKGHTEFRLDEMKNELPKALMSREKGGMLQLFPHIDKIDGFFMARMKKNV